MAGDVATHVHTHIHMHTHPHTHTHTYNIAIAICPIEGPIHTWSAHVCIGYWYAYGLIVGIQAGHTHMDCPSHTDITGNPCFTHMHMCNCTCIGISPQTHKNSMFHMLVVGFNCRVWHFISSLFYRSHDPNYI